MHHSQLTTNLLSALHDRFAPQDHFNVFVHHGAPMLDNPGHQSIHYCDDLLGKLSQRNFTCSLEGAWPFKLVKDEMVRRIKEQHTGQGRPLLNLVPLLLVSGNHFINDLKEIKEFRKVFSYFERSKSKKGIVKVRYGTQPHPINRSLTIKSNGVRIATEKNAKVRAVFNGEVIRVVKMKNVKPIVMIRHGNYITYYKNLSKVYVKEGDKVKTKQDIGEVYTNKTNGETILSFSISKESSTQNPASWIYKM